MVGFASSREKNIFEKLIFYPRNVLFSAVRKTPATSDHASLCTLEIGFSLIFGCNFPSYILIDFVWALHSTVNMIFAGQPSSGNCHNFCLALDGPLGKPQPLNSRTAYLNLNRHRDNCVVSSILYLHDEFYLS